MCVGRLLQWTLGNRTWVTKNMVLSMILTRYYLLVTTRIEVVDLVGSQMAWLLSLFLLQLILSSSISFGKNRDLIGFSLCLYQTVFFPCLLARYGCYVLWLFGPEQMVCHKTRRKLNTFNMFKTFKGATSGVLHSRTELVAQYNMTLNYSKTWL